MISKRKRNKDSITAFFRYRNETNSPVYELSKSKRNEKINKIIGQTKANSNFFAETNNIHIQKQKTINIDPELLRAKENENIQTILLV